MKKKVLKLVTVILLIAVLMSFNIVPLGYNVAVALANELDAQSNSANIANVKFDAYFKVDGRNVHTKQSNISDGENNLYINIQVLEKGSLDNAKIKIKDSNFKIKENSISNTYIKSVNVQANEIELNSIIYKNNVEIEIPIEFNKIDNVNGNYFSKETNISLEGTYKEEENEKALQGNIVTKLEWTDNAEAKFSQSIEKCIDLGENGVLIQQQITSTIENGNLPRETEEFSVVVPKIGDYLPSNIQVLSNGKKLNDTNIQYDAEVGQLKITRESTTDEEGNTSWDSDIEEYKVIYTYDKIVKENLNTIHLSTEMNSKLFTKENNQKIDEQDVEIEFKGNVVSSKKNTTQEVYKGYLYANSANETIFRENNVIEISKAEVIDYIKASTNQSYFIGSEENTYDANSIVLYKETLIKKSRFIELFGENGYLNIKDSNGNVIATVNNQSETSEDGDIHITYAQPLTGIYIETSKPIQEGQFTIHHVKYIQGNTGYAKNQLKTFTRFNTNEVVETNLGLDQTEANINLLDTVTEARLEINNTNLSTLQKNENVQFTITLKTASEKYDLFKNPVIELTLPSSISNIDVKSVNKVYADEFNIEYARLRDGANGEKIIQIALSGQQSDYSKEINELAIVINADIEFGVLTASQESSIVMSYTNENGNEKTYQTSVDIHIESKPGMMIYNNLSGFNTAGDSIYTIDDTIPMGVLDIESGAMTARVSTAIINNYDIEIENVVIIGRIPKKGTHDGTVDTTLQEGIRTNIKDIEILYSQNTAATQDDGSWSTDNTNASSYMIKLDSVAAGQAIALQYEIGIPENIGYGQSIYTQTNMTYTYLGNVNTQTSIIGAKSETLVTNNILALANTVETEKQGLGIAISAVSGGSELEEGTAIYEGQKILYTMRITNNTGSDLHNVNIKATQTNGNIYGLIEEEALDPVLGDDSLKTYHRYDELDTNVNDFATIERLANGESTVISYEIVVSEVEGEDKQTYGDIQITADDREATNFSTIKNNIKQAELKLTISNPYYEEETIYLGKKLHVNIKVENISGEELKHIKGKIQLPDKIYCNAGTDLIWSQTTINGEDSIENETKLENLAYDKENNELTFDMSSMKKGEITELELYVQIDENIEKEENFAFMYEMETNHTYVSNTAIIKVLNEKRNISVEQVANISDDVKLKDNDTFDLTIKVHNNEDEELNFGVFDTLPNGFTVKSARGIVGNEEIQIPIVDNLEEDEDIAFKIYENRLTGEILLSGQSSIQITMTIEVDSEWITTDSVNNIVDVTYGKLTEEENYYIYEWKYGVTSEKKFLIQTEEAAWVEIMQVANPETNTILEDGQDIIYTFYIQNMRANEIVTTLYDYIPKGIHIDKVTLDGKTLEAGDVYVEGHTIEANATSILEISGHADISELENSELVNNLTVSTVAGDITSNDIVYKIVKTEVPEDPDPDNPDPDNPDPDNPDPDNPDPDNPDPDNPDPDNPDPDNPDPDNPSEEETYTISGIAWVDANKDGRRDAQEKILSGVGVSVIDANKGTYVEGVNTTTSENGQYEIHVAPGNYILVFTYNTQMYRLTEYRKQGVQENENSDVINKTITNNGINITVGATDTINVNSSNVENIDIGLIEVSTFDLELNKYVSEIVVQTNKSTTKYGYNNQDLVKVEIPAKEINNATVIVKYAIQITNVGEIAGYVQNIVDYMPSDLDFSSELNKDWYQANSNLQNNSLSNVVIEPGQTQTVELVLVKTVTGDNTGTIINTAEIAEASNSLGISDTDSTPGNNNASEDDYGRAEVIISVETGRMVVFISIIMTILIVTAVTVLIINKKILRPDERKI